MHVPRPSKETEDLFRTLVPEAPGVTVRPMFANLAAFVNGNMFAGLFGDAIGVRLPEEAVRARLLAVEGAGPYGPPERLTLLQVADGALPVNEGARLYVDGANPEIAAEYGTVVASPAEADVALVRVNAPWEHRDDLFLEAWFHQGSLEFPLGEVERIRSLAAQVPVILVVNLDRGAILTPFVEMPGVVALAGVYGAGDAAVLDALTGRIPPLGRLPLELPSSMAAVEAHAPDQPGGSADALFPLGHGLRLPVPSRA